MNWLEGKRYYRWIILVACMLVYCTSQLVRWNYASITKYLSTDLGMGKPEIGLLGSAFFYAYRFMGRQKGHPGWNIGAGLVSGRVRVQHNFYASDRMANPDGIRRRRRICSHYFRPG